MFFYCSNLIRKIIVSFFYIWIQKYVYKVIIKSIGNKDSEDYVLFYDKNDAIHYIKDFYISNVRNPYNINIAYDFYLMIWNKYLNANNEIGNKIYHDKYRKTFLEDEGEHIKHLRQMIDAMIPIIDGSLENDVNKIVCGYVPGYNGNVSLSLSHQIIH